VILMAMRCMYWTAMPRNIENESKKRHDFKNEGSILKEIFNLIQKIIHFFVK
jgi:hypothetical protein